MNGIEKEVCRNYFYEMTLVAPFTIHVNLHAIEFPLIFGDTNFVEVPKIHKMYGPQKRAPYIAVAVMVASYYTLAICLGENFDLIPCQVCMHICMHVS